MYKCVCGPVALSVLPLFVMFHLLLLVHFPDFSESIKFSNIFRLTSYFFCLAVVEQFRDDGWKAACAVCCHNLWH